MRQATVCDVTLCHISVTHRLHAGRRAGSLEDRAKAFCFGVGTGRPRALRNRKLCPLRSAEIAWRTCHAKREARDGRRGGKARGPSSSGRMGDAMPASTPARRQSPGPHRRVRRSDHYSRKLVDWADRFAADHGRPPTSDEQRASETWRELAGGPDNADEEHPRAPEEEQRFDRRALRWLLARARQHTRHCI